jgi:hypothetical protein
MEQTSSTGVDRPSSDGRGDDREPIESGVTLLDPFLRCPEFVSTKACH